MRILTILVITCTLLSVGCTIEKPNETPNYDAGIEAYKTWALYNSQLTLKRI